MPLPIPIFVLGQCIVGRGFAQTLIGGVTGALGRTRSCDLLIRSRIKYVLGRSLNYRNLLVYRAFVPMRYSVFTRFSFHCCQRPRRSNQELLLFPVFAGSIGGWPTGLDPATFTRATIRCRPFQAILVRPVIGPI